ncbi:MAG: hypothetical protein IKC11_06135 [Clostridia bacterium]|nr:hypothetical protein [Clostridia bacterium]
MKNDELGNVNIQLKTNFNYLGAPGRGKGGACTKGGEYKPKLGSFAVMKEE